MSCFKFLRKYLIWIFSTHQNHCSLFIATLGVLCSPGLSVVNCGNSVQYDIDAQAVSCEFLTLSTGNSILVTFLQQLHVFATVIFSFLTPVRRVKELEKAAGAGGCYRGGGKVVESGVAVTRGQRLPAL